MSPASDLQALLRELRGVRSPVQRMKLLTLGWRTVRRLTPTERKVLANQLGMDGLDGVLSRLGRRDDGITPTELMQVLEKADDIDPSKLGQLFRDLKDPGKRKALIRRGLDVLQEHLAEDEEEQEETKEDEVSPEKSTERLVTPEELRPPVIVPPPPPAAPVSEPAPPVVEPKLEKEEEEEDEATTAEPVPAAPAAEPEAEPAQVEPEPVAPPAPVVVVPPPVVTPPPERAPEVSEAGADIAGWVNRLGATASLTARFRLLRRLISEENDLDLAELKSIVASFPDGWARRRSIERLLRAGHAADLDDAFALIEDLERPGDRRWCCAALIDSRELTREETERLSTLFPFPFLVRRMRRTVAVP